MSLLKGDNVKKLLLSILIFSMAAFAHASQVLPNTEYTLLDHPDGAIANPPAVTYGLRIVNETWSVEQDGAVATMEWNGVNFAQMGGTASNNATDALWNFEYLMFGAVPSADGFIATAGTGILSDGNTAYFLTGKFDGDAVARFLPDGHRCAGEPCANGMDTIVGRGWWDVLKIELPDAQPMVKLAVDAMRDGKLDLYDERMADIYGRCEADGWNKCMKKLHGDFLVQAVPVPAAVWLFGSALVGLVGLRRNRQTS
ncbi:MAG: hypothetical protein AAF372_05275 [Pseudomonadota bacterium]